MYSSIEIIIMNMITALAGATADRGSHLKIYSYTRLYVATWGYF